MPDRQISPRDGDFDDSLAGAGGGIGTVRRGQAPGIRPDRVAEGPDVPPGYAEPGAGETVTIVNDDSDLLHHAYVDSPTFSFDSGDQEPGSRTPITFNQEGVFQVLCGIHPKMKLVVRVK
ncbi:hypothetical protein ACFQFG_11530 [Methylobacterium persicinum]